MVFHEIRAKGGKTPTMCGFMGENTHLPPALRNNPLLALIFCLPINTQGARGVSPLRPASPCPDPSKHIIGGNMQKRNTASECPLWQFARGVVALICNAKIRLRFRLYPRRYRPAALMIISGGDGVNGGYTGGTGRKKSASSRPRQITARPAQSRPVPVRLARFCPKTRIFYGRGSSLYPPKRCPPPPSRFCNPRHQGSLSKYHCTVFAQNPAAKLTLGCQPSSPRIRLGVYGVNANHAPVYRQQIPIRSLYGVGRGCNFIQQSANCTNKVYIRGFVFPHRYYSSARRDPFVSPIITPSA